MNKMFGIALQLGSIVAMLSLPALADGVPENEIHAAILSLVLINLIAGSVTLPVEHRREESLRFA